MNHSCDPNVQVVTENKPSAQMDVTALKPINKGDEIWYEMTVQWRTMLTRGLWFVVLATSTLQTFPNMKDKQKLRSTMHLNAAAQDVRQRSNKPAQ
jgi:SET domain-containing protein